MIRLFYSLLIAHFVFLVSPDAIAQRQDQDRILLTVADEEVSVDEFLYAFYKNNSKESGTTQEEIDEYLDLYIKFKLKVVEAKSQNYHTTEEFSKEYKQYIGQLQNSYLVSDTETDRLVKEAYERLKTEVSASHILFNLDPNASPNDTMAVYNESMKVRDRVIAGEDFGVLAQQLSQDPSAKTNKGFLGYFSALQMVYPFENAAFEAEPGEISMPVRTQFGYHLIKVNDRRPSEGKVHVAHIMIQPPSQQGEDEINLVYEKLQAGVDWAELCLEHSDDRRTSGNGGELAPFSRGQIVPEFAEVAFSLSTPGEFSDPLKTQFGWHIIKLIERIPLKSFEEMEEELIRRVKRDSRNDVNRQVLIERLSRENELVRSEDGEQELMALPKTLFVNNRWQLDSTYLNSKTSLFSIQDSTYSLGQFLKQMIVRVPHDSTASFLNKRLVEYTNEALIQYEKDHLADKYDDYRFLSKEYYEGILLFSIMENEVWNKALADSVGLESFYEDSKDSYPRNKGTEAIIFSSDNRSGLEAILDSLSSSPLQKLLSEAEKQAFKDKYSNSDNVSLSVEQGFYEEGVNELVELAIAQDKLEIIENNGKMFLVMVVGSYEAGPEPLKNIRGKVMADYQDYLEKQWVEQLKSKYTVEIESKTLNYVYKQARKK